MWSSLQRREVWAVLASAAITAGVLTPPAYAAPTPSAAPPALSPESAPPVAAKTPKVLIIGIDGMVADRVADADAPTLQEMQATSTDARSLLYASPMAATVSGPGWATVLTGVWPDKHGIVDNTFAGTRIDEYPSLFAHLEDVAPKLDTYAAVDWLPIADEILQDDPDRVVRRDGDSSGYRSGDRQITRATAGHLRSDSADVTYAYFGQLDIMGHEHGSASRPYVREIGRMDDHVTDLLDAIEARPTRSDEDWLVLVTTDHGHLRSGGHGGATLIERGTFVLASGDGVPTAQPTTTRLVDLATTVFAHVGVPVDPSWALDGRSVFAADSDAFQGQASALKAARTEDIPRKVLGWTHRLPPGWSADSSALPVRGVPEWRGWTLTTDAFWSQAQEYQGRETFVRGRGVIAVADSDEWADADDSGDARFDATLWTAAADVTGDTTLDVALTQWYRHDSGSVGQVLLQIDDHAASVVTTYRSSTPAGPAVLTYDLPAGAHTARVGFRMQGTNSWYWAIDDVQLHPRG